MRSSKIVGRSTPTTVLSLTITGRYTATEVSTNGAGQALDPILHFMADEPSVLLVEDDAALASMLADLLGGEGYNVVVAGDGQRALHEGLSRHFDVMVMDRGLPAIEGLEVLERLRRKGITTPALILSALSNPADRVEGLDRGAEDYLGKPFDIEELLARIRALLRRHADTSFMVRVPGVPLMWAPGRWRLTAAPRWCCPNVNASFWSIWLAGRSRSSPERVFWSRSLLMPTMAAWLIPTCIISARNWADHVC